MRTRTGYVHDHEHVKILEHNYLDRTVCHKEGYKAEQNPANAIEQIVGCHPFVMNPDSFIEHPKSAAKFFFLESLFVLSQNVYEDRWHHYDY